MWLGEKHYYATRYRGEKNIIVSIIGPAGVGKSTFASRFILEHPYFTLCDISGYRAESSNETEAWELLEKDINKNKDIVLETCGLNYQLRPLFRRLKHRHVFTILMTGEAHELQRRVKERQKKRIPPFKYRFSDELDSIEWVLDHIDETPIDPDLIIPTTVGSPNKDYNFITNAILERRLMVGHRW
jgi:guanylate kinase